MRTKKMNISKSNINTFRLLKKPNKNADKSSCKEILSYPLWL